MPLNVEHREGAIEVTDRVGRRILITEDDTMGGMIVTFPDGAFTSGMTPFTFAFEDDMRSECREKFHLSVCQPLPEGEEWKGRPCKGCP